MGRLANGGRSPDCLHHLKGLGVEVAEFGGDEGVEIVPVEVGFGGFGEVFLMIGGGVVLSFAPGEGLDVLENAFFHGGVVSGDD